MFTNICPCNDSSPPALQPVISVSFLPVTRLLAWSPILWLLLDAIPFLVLSQFLLKRSFNVAALGKVCRKFWDPSIYERKINYIWKLVATLTSPVINNKDNITTHSCYIIQLWQVYYLIWQAYYLTYIKSLVRSLTLFHETHN